MKRRYRVLVGLHYPTDPRIVKRLLAGEPIPREARGERRAEPGEIVDDIPPQSVPWLLEQGAIVEVTGGEV